MDRIYVVGEMYGGRMQKKELQEMAAAPSGMFKTQFFASMVLLENDPRLKRLS